MLVYGQWTRPGQKKTRRERERVRILIITLNMSGRAAVHLYCIITHNIMYDMTLARYKLS